MSWYAVRMSLSENFLSILFVLHTSPTSEHSLCVLLMLTSVPFLLLCLVVLLTLCSQLSSLRSCLLVSLYSSHCLSGPILICACSVPLVMWVLSDLHPSSVSRLSYPHKFSKSLCVLSSVPFKALSLVLSLISWLTPHSINLIMCTSS